MTRQALDAFVALAGPQLWKARMAEIGARAASGPRAGQAVRQRHALELAIERLRGTLTRPASTAELHAARLAGDAVALSRSAWLGTARAGCASGCRTALAGDGTLVPVFHMLRTAALQASRGFDVAFAGLADAAPYDLLIARGQLEAEIACEVVSAEEGRLVHRGAWSHLADRVDADLRAWLSTYPGRYLLKMTLPQGLESTAPGGDAWPHPPPAGDPGAPRSRCGGRAAARTAGAGRARYGRGPDAVACGASSARRRIWLSPPAAMACS